MRRYIAIFAVLLAGVLALMPCTADEEAVLPAQKEEPKDVNAAVIICKGMIDDGLFKSIKRRTQIALDGGAKYLIYQIETYGGFLESGDSISKYFILDIADKVHTVTYVNTEAISAGAMIAVSCRDVIMRENTTIGDCAPIAIGQKLEGVEREKAESFVRAAFERAAEANKYPKLLLKAMVGIKTDIYRVKNIKTGEYEYFENEQLPDDEKKYDLKNKELIVKKDQILTLTASKAAEYGIARAVVKDVDEALTFLEGRDGVKFAGKPLVLETNWSEDMVRWLNSPAVMGILLMVGMLALYVEFNTPGIGLPGLVAVICFTILIGSKFLIGLANWVEIALFILGIVLLLVEIFLIPGFGITGFLGIACILAGLFGMLIKNPPDRFPWPQSEFDWQLFNNSVIAIAAGFTGFVILAVILAKYMPQMKFMSGLVLAPSAAKQGTEVEASYTAPPQAGKVSVTVGQTGEAVSRLRPAGKAKFGDAVVDVVAEGDFIDKGAKVKIIEIHGNRVVVRVA